MKALLPINLFVGWGWRRRGSGHLKIIIASNTAVCLLISEWVVQNTGGRRVKYWSLTRDDRTLVVRRAGFFPGWSLTGERC